MKNGKKIISAASAVALFLTTLLSLPLSAFAEENWTVISSGNDGIELSSGDYVVAQNTKITAGEAGESAIKIKENSIVTIHMQNLATLEVIGADGDGRTGGGAGIWIPSSATLTITGTGTVIAKGGNAGNGGDGQDGDQITHWRILEFVGSVIDFLFTGNWHIQSAGGLGGDGGGGAGAGIGTPGGYGAEGGNPGFSATGTVVGEDGKTTWDRFNQIDGLPGKKANAAAAMGTLNSTDITFVVTGGQSGEGGSGGNYARKNTSAGGGGGGGGYAAAAVGTGGSSGAGGGGGGASPYESTITTSHFNSVGGEGGYGGNAGEAGASTPFNADYSSGGVGGTGGAGGSKAKEKSFSVIYSTNGGDTLTKTSYTYSMAKAADLKTPNKDNFEFVGWYYSPEFEGGAVSQMIPLRDAGNKTLYANWESAYVPTVPAVYTEGTNIVLSENDFDVTNLSIAYIGSTEKTVSSFEEFEAAGKLYKAHNGDAGFTEYGDPQGTKSVPISKNGYYAVCYCYTENEAEKENFAVLKIDSIGNSLPYLTSELNKITLHSDYYDLCSVKLAYIGVNQAEIQDWDSFVLAGKKYTDVNGPSGYTETGSVSDGSVWEKADGFYAACIDYYDDEEVLASVYSVVEVNDTSAAKPYIEINDDAELVLHTNGNTVSRLSYAYIGTEEQHFMSWSAFENAGKKHPEANGTVGCNHVNNPQDGNKHIVEFNGYWSAFINYDDKDGVNHKIYVTAKCDNPMLDVPHLRVNEDVIKIYTKDFPVDRVSIAYIGTEAMDIYDWSTFYDAGMAHQDVNGSIGCNHYNNVPDGYTWARDDGYYAFFVRYADETGSVKIRYQVVRVDCSSVIRPTVSSENGKIVLDAKGYAVSRLSIAYIGDEAIKFSSWGAFENAGKKYADVNGSIGCYHVDNPADGYSRSLSRTGYWAAFMRYTDGSGITKTTYATFENESVRPVIEVINGAFVLSTNGYDVDRVSVAYIGEQPVNVYDWPTFYDAGIAYKDINGSLGCKHYDNVPDGYTWLKDKGCYAFFIRYDDQTQKIYQVAQTDGASAERPTVYSENGNMILDANGNRVTRLSIAYIGNEEIKFYDWAPFENAGKKYLDINGKYGCVHVDNPVDHYLYQLNRVGGYWAAYLGYTDKNGATQKTYVTFKYEEPYSYPYINVNGGSMFLSTNGHDDVDRVSVAYIGEQEMTITNWDEFYDAGIAYKDINGSLGCNHYNNVPDGYTWVRDNGYYAFFIRYDNQTQKIYQVVKMEGASTVRPGVASEDGNMVLDANGCDVLRISLAYIGDKEITFNNWGLFESAGKKYADINSNTGCVHMDNPKDGYSRSLSRKGYWTAFIRFVDENGNIQTTYVTFQNE